MPLDSVGLFAIMHNTTVLLVLGPHSVLAFADRVPSHSSQTARDLLGRGHIHTPGHGSTRNERFRKRFCTSFGRPSRSSPASSEPVQNIIKKRSFRAFPCPGLCTCPCTKRSHTVRLKCRATLPKKGPTLCGPSARSTVLLRISAQVAHCPVADVGVECLCSHALWGCSAQPTN